MTQGTGEVVKSLYEAPSESEGPAVVCEWKDEPKDAEEAQKREAIENYVKYISSTKEFKEEFRSKISKEFKKALDDGRI